LRQIATLTAHRARESTDELERMMRAMAGGMTAFGPHASGVALSCMGWQSDQSCLFLELGFGNR
jgi:hypothetical protein